MGGPTGPDVYIISYPKSGRTWLRVLLGLTVGLIAGAVLGIFVVIASTVDVRGVLVRISPPLLEFLSFGLPSGLAFLVHRASRDVAMGAGNTFIIRLG